MKTKKTVLIFATGLLGLINVHSQVYTTSSGCVGIQDQHPQRNFQVAGNSVFSRKDSTLISAPEITGHDIYSSAVTPDYTWFNDSTTGIFHPSSGNWPSVLQLQKHLELLQAEGYCLQQLLHTVF